MSASMVPLRAKRTVARSSLIPAGAVIVMAVLLKAAAVASAAGIIWIHVCGSYTPGTGGTNGTIGVAHSGSSAAGLSTPYQCPTSANGVANGMDIIGNGSVPAGSRADWQIDAPAGLTIVEAHTEGSGMISYGVNQNMGWGGGFYWQGGGAQATESETGYSSPSFSSPYFGWQIICGATTCNGGSKPGEVGVLGLELEAAETSGPTVAPTSGSLGTGTGWVRGTWPIAFTADGPTGACQLGATLGGASVSQPVNEPSSNTNWHQCPASGFSQSFNTAGVPSGYGIPLAMWARDAAYDYAAHAYLSNTVTKSVNIDNEPVNLSLSGPSDAPTTAGTQYVSAVAAAGPSAIAGISCSTDGAPDQWYPGASAQIPVSGLGNHVVQCEAANNAVDPAGNRTWSPTESSSVDIREPAIAGIAFTRIVNKLRCRKVKKRVKVPAHWVIVRRHHHGVRVHRRAHTKIVRVTRCHPRTKRERIKVWKTVHRHGKKVRVRRTKIVRVVVLPRAVNHTTRRIRHGRATTVNGWLGTSTGTALAGQEVVVLTAADNGLGKFHTAGVVTTRANGSWTARLHAGPSRLVEAVYPGAPLVEPATSGQVRLIVPAKIKLRIRPTHTHWGGTIHISGRVLGGYLPRGKLLRLRIGAEGVSGTAGIPDVTSKGRFHTTWTFAQGAGRVRYWFAVSTLPEADYPYASGNSPRRTVSVGP